MDEKSVVASLALHAVLEPVFEELEGNERHIAAVHTLRTAFTKAERAHPGLCQDFIAGVLDAEGVSINLPEALLRLACHDYQQYVIDSQEEEFVQLNLRAKVLKQKLGRIPDQIQDRSKFLQIISVKKSLCEFHTASNKHYRGLGECGYMCIQKIFASEGDIASAIKEVLDAVNEVSKKHQTDTRMKEYKKVLDNHKKVFVKSSRSFSDTLKRYFKDGRSENVFLSANRLINHTNALLSTYKAIGC